MLHFKVSRLFIIALLFSLSATPISSMAYTDPRQPLSTPCILPTPPTGAITGQVTAADTGQPLSFVQVRGYLGALEVAFGSTDQNGNYVLARLRTGTYTVQFGNKPPYAGEWYNNQAAQTMATPIMVSSGMTTTAINGALDLGAVISGVVTATDTSLPLKNVTVSSYDAAGKAVRSVLTDAQGQYKLEGLMSGDYQLAFQPSGTTDPYLTEWYNDKPNQSAADFVSVVAPNLVSNINVGLTRGGQISGQVTGVDTGSGLGNVVVRVYDSTGKLFFTTFTNGSGTYTTAGLPSGSYTLYFETPNFGAVAAYVGEWYNDKPNQVGADLVSVTAPNVTANVNAALTKGGTISGKVTAAESGIHLTKVSVYAYNPAGDIVDTVILDNSGAYTMTGLPSGNYKVRFTPYGLDNSYLQEWYNDKANEASADSVTVSAPNTTTNIDAALTKGGQIRGRVTAEESGTGLGDVTVWVYDQDGRYFASRSTNASGYYTVTAIATGNYFVEFEPSRVGVAANYLTEWYNNKPDRSSADSVPVTAPNVTANIDAALGIGSHICGTVTASDTSAGLDDVTIQIYNAAGQYQGSVSTDASGNYISPALSNGSYKLQFDPPSSGGAASYIAEWYNDKVDQAAANPIVLTGPNADTVINAALTKGAQINGQITFVGAISSVDDVDITVYDQNNRFAGSANVDATGIYTTSGLPVGNYKILAQPEGDGAAQSYALQWYNNKPNQTDADLVAVTSLTLVRGIDFTLTVGGRIAGKVSAADTGVGLDDVGIGIYDIAGRYVGFAGADANGLYSTPALRDGNYKLRFTTFGDADGYQEEWYKAKDDVNLADDIVVTSPKPTTGIDVVLRKRTTTTIFLPLVQR